MSTIADDLFADSKPAAPGEPETPKAPDTRVADDLFGDGPEPGQARVNFLTDNAKETPEQASRIHDLHGRTGLPRAFIAENFDEVNREASTVEFSSRNFIRNNPRMQDWIAKNPEYIPLLREDQTTLEALSDLINGESKGDSWRTLYEKGKETTAHKLNRTWIAGTQAKIASFRNAPLETPVNIGKGLMKDFGYIAAFMSYLAKTPVDFVFGKDYKELSTYMAKVDQGTPDIYFSPEAMDRIESDPLYKEAMDRAKYHTQRMQDFALSKDTSLIKELVFSSGTSIVSDVAPMLVGARFGGVAGGTGVFTTSVYSDTLAENLAEGKSLAEATERAMWKVMSEGLPEALPWSVAVKKGRALWKTIFGTSITEGGEEMLTELMDIAYERFKDNKEITLLEAMERSFKAGAVGVTTGGVIGLGHAGPAAIRQNRIEREQKLRKEMFEALGDLSKKSALAKRQPQLFSEAVEQMTKDGPVENLYVPVELFQSHFRTQQIDPEQLANEMGIRRQYDEAVNTGDRIAIPTGVYAAYIAGTEHHGAFANDWSYRLPDGTMAMSANEFKAFTKEAEEQIADDRAEADQEFNASIDKVMAPLREQIRALYPEGQSSLYATLFESRLRARAKRLGVSPEQLMQERPLSIEEAEILQRAQTLNQKVPAEHLANLDETNALVLARKYEEADAIKPRFDSMVTALADAVGGKVRLAGLKQTGRASEKVRDEYAGDANRIRDIVRATLSVDTEQAARQVLDMIRTELGVPESNITDRISNPTEEGYRDIKINIDVDGHMTELQINLPAMLEAKDKAHDLYEAKRKLKDRLFRENRVATKDEQAELADLIAKQRAIYDAAWEATMASNRSFEITTPLRSAESGGKGLGAGLSNALQKPGIDGSWATGMPSTSRNTASFEKFTESPPAPIIAKISNIDTINTAAGWTRNYEGFYGESSRIKPTIDVNSPGTIRPLVDEVLSFPPVPPSQRNRQEFVEAWAEGDVNALRAIYNDIVKSGFPAAALLKTNGIGVHVGTGNSYAYYSSTSAQIGFEPYILSAVANGRNELEHIVARMFGVHEVMHSLDSVAEGVWHTVTSPYFSVDPKTPLEVQVIRGEVRDVRGHKNWGPVIKEALEVFRRGALKHEAGYSAVGEFLSYPFMSMFRSEVIDGTFVQVETLAQLGALYYTYPELTKRVLPEGYALMEKLDAAIRKRRSAHGVDAAVREILGSSPERDFADPKGRTGRYTVAGAGREEAGYGLEGAAQEESARQSLGIGIEFYSPNVEEHLTFNQAVKRLNSEDHARFVDVSNAVDQEIGIESRGSTAALGDWSDGAENSVASFLNAKSFEDVEYSAAIKGMLGKQKAVVAFFHETGGKDSVWVVDLPNTDFRSVRDAASKAGIEYRTLIKTPDGVRLMVFDEGTKLQSNIEEFANAQGQAEVDQIEGTGKIIGSDTRIGADRKFRRIISAYESNHPETGRKFSGYGTPAYRRSQEKVAPLYQKADTWYSALQRGLETAKQKSASGSDWKAIASKFPGVKRDEIDAVGLNEWLDLQTGQVTREQVLDFVRQNGVQVREVTLGEPGKMKLKGFAWRSSGSMHTLGGIDESGRVLRGVVGSADEQRNLAYIHVNSDGSFDVEAGDASDIDGEEIGSFMSLDAAKRAAEQLAPEDNVIPTGTKETKFDEWQLHGGENYRELLLTLPSTMKGGWGVIDNDGYINERFDTEQQAKEAAHRSGLTYDKVQPDSSNDFRSGHFSEPNILAHVRFNERTDADGKRVLFIEEVQSDWAQKGRKKGFKDDFIEGLTVKKDDHGIWRIRKKNGHLFEIDGVTGYTTEKMARESLDEATNARAFPGVPSAPFVKDTQSWAMLAMKRMIRYAAENGFDRIAWTTGEQQADRYDLSKQLSKITYIYNNRRQDYEIHGYDHRDEQVVRELRIKEERLPVVVGKEMAEKIISGENDRDYGEDAVIGDLTGLELKVGGEGMRAFYDQMLPQWVNKYVKKWGGKVGETRITVPETSVKFSERGKDRSNKIHPAVHSFDITPAMRESVMQGQPLFQGGDVTRRRFDERFTPQTETAEFKKWFGDSKVVDETGKPLVVYHGTTADFSSFDASKPWHYERDKGLIYFYSSASAASSYAEGMADAYGGNANVIPVYLAINKPLVVDVNGEPSEAWDSAGGKYHDAMRSGGHDGAIVRSSTSSEVVYVATLSNQIKSATGNRGTFDPASPDIMMQGAEDIVRGSFTSTNQGDIIRLFKSRNLSTLLHEASHRWLFELIDDASRPDAPQELKDDLAKVLKYLGVESAEQLDIRRFDEGSPEHDRAVAANEKWARSGEAYLKEGKAPSPALRSAFARFKAWLVSLYDALKQGKLDVQLTDEIRGVFDRLLATQQEIDAARADAKHVELFMTAEDAGMTDQEFKAYRKSLEDAHRDAQDRIDAQIMREYKRTLNEEYRKAREVVRQQIDQQVGELPPYRALDKLAEQGIKLNRDEVMALGPDVSRRVPRGTMAADGVPLDVAADGLGFSSGAEMVRSIAAVEKRAAMVSRLTDARMAEMFGDMLTDGTMLDEARLSLANDSRAEVIAAEIKALQRKARQVQPFIKAEKAKEKAADRAGAEMYRQVVPKVADVREHARQVISGKPIREIKPNHYFDTARQASRAAIAAVRKKDYLMAAYHKGREMLNLEMYREAMKAQDLVEDGNTKITRAFVSDIKQSKSKNMDMVNAARAMLAAHGIGKSDVDPMVYLDDIRQYDPKTYENLRPIFEPSLRSRKHYGEMTLEEYIGLRDTVLALMHGARRSMQVKIAGKLMDQEQVVMELAARIDEISKKGPDEKLRTTMSDMQKLRVGLLSVKATLRRVEHWVDAMDGGNPDGVFRRYIWTPIAEAANRYRDQRSKVMSKYLVMFQEVAKTIVPGEIPAKKLGFKFKNKGELLHAILHRGNNSNFQKLLRGYGWGEMREDGTLDTSKWDDFEKRMQDEGVLTKADYDFAQNVWDLMEEMKPELQKAHHEMYGYYFDEVTANEFTNRFGTYRGGYVPAKVDPNVVHDAEIKQDRQDILHGQNSFSFPTTGRGATMKRIEGYAKPLQLDLRSIPVHIDWAMRFAHIEPAVKDIGSVMLNRDFVSAMETFDPTAIKHMLTPWLQRAASQRTSTRGMNPWLDKFWTGVRTRSGMQLMVANVINTLQQYTGFPVALLKVKATSMRGAFWEYTTNRGAVLAEINEKSAFMRNRVFTAQNEVLQTVDELLLNPSKYEKLKDFTTKHGYFMQQATQGFVDVVVWKAAYNEAIEANVSDHEAVLRADSVVRETQGSFAPEDLSRAEAGTPFTRAFLMFYNYFNMIANLMGTEFRNIATNELGLAKGSARALYVYTMAMIIPAFIGDALLRALIAGKPDEDDEGYLDDVIAMFFDSQFRAATAMVPGLSPVAQAIRGTFTKRFSDDRITASPAVSMLESAVKVPYYGYKAAIGEGYDLNAKRVTKDTLTMVGMLTGLPVAALGRPLGYLADVEQGKAQPENAMDVVRGLVSGQDVNR